MKNNINTLLDKVKKITATRNRDRIVLEYADGTAASVTAGEAIDQCKTRTDIMRASGGPEQGLLPQLITGLYEGGVHIETP